MFYHWAIFPHSLKIFILRQDSVRLLWWPSRTSDPSVSAFLVAENGSDHSLTDISLHSCLMKPHPHFKIKSDLIFCIKASPDEHTYGNGLSSVELPEAMCQQLGDFSACCLDVLDHKLLMELGQKSDMFLGLFFRVLRTSFMHNKCIIKTLLNKKAFGEIWNPQCFKE